MPKPTTFAGNFYRAAYLRLDSTEDHSRERALWFLCNIGWPRFRQTR